MKKIKVLLPLLAALLLLSALPAFSGSGPYGNSGPSDNTFIAQGFETPHNATVGGSGPYGAYGPTDKGSGTSRTTLASGTGPYGTFDSSGMLVKVKSRANREECFLTAKNCP